ncbi:MAG: hypothetical protein HOK52_04815 [Candidatus Marinimicrobia bacterium]|jgi:hypothetical protein|nr:hypothetical protein [Candidatus Neomarinimicrobiota bacterium]
MENKIRITKQDIHQLHDFITKFDFYESIDLIEDEGAIGSTLHVQVEDNEKGYKLIRKYEISGVEDW